MALWLGVGSLLPLTQTSQLHNLPSLLEHYQHHTDPRGEHHESLSFVEFLLLHYNPFSGHQSQESHQDLPLFGGDWSLNLWTEWPGLSGLSFVKEFVWEWLVPPTFLYVELYDFSFLGSLMRPPCR